jgi:ABC-type multidrug transport system ATPase subunit
MLETSHAPTLTSDAGGPFGHVRQRRYVAGGDAIRLESIRKSFPTSIMPVRVRRSQPNIPVLTDITLHVRSGEVMALVGANGAGKTTLLEILATVQLPTGGRAVVGGYDLVHQAHKVRRIIGYCPAGTESFYPQLTGQANLEFFAALHGCSPRDARTRTANILDLLGAGGIGPIVVQRCSAGMKQKLTLARALLGNPAILLLDEPTKSLDADARVEFYRLVRHNLVDGLNKTVLLVTHDLHEAKAICDRVAFIGSGTITRVGTVGDGTLGLPATVPVRSAVAG